jgi:hypothetical protein
MAEQLNFYDIVKTYRGNLCLTLPAYDLSAPSREVYIPHNVSKVRISRTFALGIFTNPTIEKMYKEGYFRVEPAKQFEAEVAEIFYPVEDKVEVVAEDEMVTMLIKGNRQAVKELIAGNDVNRDNIIMLAREHLDEIPVSMVNDLNKILGVELQIEDASVE